MPFTLEESSVPRLSGDNHTEKSSRGQGLGHLQAKGMGQRATLSTSRRWLDSSLKGCGPHCPNKRPHSYRHMPYSGFQGGQRPDATGTVFYRTHTCPWEASP